MRRLEQLAAFVSGLVEQKLEKDKKLSAETLRHWGEIIEGEYQYNREVPPTLNPKPSPPSQIPPTPIGISAQIRAAAPLLDHVTSTGT